VANVLVGNIGKAALEALPDVLEKGHAVIYEMSSYQTHDLSLGPSIAVITRLFPEHLDWHGSAEAYFASKLNIARAQRGGDVTIWNATDPELAARVPFGPGRHLKYGMPDGVVFSKGTYERRGRILFNDRGMRLRGLHNRLNACAAFTAAELLGATPRDMQEVLASFTGLPHRLEDLGVHGGVRWVNDSISTAPEAAVAALEALGDDVATYIGGGTDRGFDFAPLALALAAARIPHVILMPPGGPRMADAIDGDKHLVTDLEEAVRVARELTPPGKTVLFSPASPSYGTFRNFEERGNAFRALVTGPTKSR
jgi:UDP-N-acetylmuramoylalanine--D-glutamate ligase